MLVSVVVSVSAKNVVSVHHCHLPLVHAMRADTPSGGQLLVKVTTIATQLRNF